MFHSLEDLDERENEEEGDLNCQLFWDITEEKDLDDHLEFEDEGMSLIQSEIDMMDNVI